MNRFKSLFIGAVILCLALFSSIASAQVLQVAFFDSFTDGELDNNPTWTYDNTNWAVVNGELHSDGMILDQSGSYRTLLYSQTDLETQGNLEISYRGVLKSVGNPQVGRGTTVAIVNYLSGDRYDLNIENGYTSGFPVNKTSISLKYSTPNTPVDLIVSSFVPEYDHVYEVRAIRQDGIWSLYADGNLIGSAVDPLQQNNFNALHLVLTGSVMVDDIQVRVESVIIPVPIDIKPGSYPNCFNNDGHGVIPVAIFSTSVFDASEVNPETVTLDGQGVRIVGKGNLQASLEDVNTDGYLDLVLQIEDIDGTYTKGDAFATLIGETFDGFQIQGTDAICIRP